MTLKPASKLETLTKGELLAMCKLVQMVTHHGEYYTITPDVWKAYLMSSMGLDDATATILINKARQVANRILNEA